jgi:uncharacterized protein
MQLGRINHLTINRITPPGAYLEDILENEVLLPKKYLLPEHEIGTEVDVFVHKDSENRIVATTETPYILLGEFKYLAVVHVNPYGAFVDWGLDKDLLVPYSEQLHSLEEREKYLFTLCYDQATDRLFGSMKIKKLLIPCSEDLTGKEVDILICEKTSLGLNVIVNEQHDGLIFKNDISKHLPCGTYTKGFVRKVRDDGKSDPHSEAPTNEKFDQASVFLLNFLKEEKILYLNDNSHPDEIREKLGMSKKLFKQTVGKLYRQKKITLGEDCIRLV